MNRCFFKVVVIAMSLFASAFASKCGKSGAEMHDNTMIAIVKDFIKRYPALSVLPGRSNELRYFHSIKGAKKRLQILVINLGDKTVKYSNSKLLAAAYRVVACDGDNVTQGGWFRYGDIEYNFDPMSF